MRGVDIITDVLPYVSNWKDGTTAYTGVNPITKEHAGTGERVVAGVLAIPGLGNLLKGAKYLLKGSKAAYEGWVAARAASKIAKAAERELARVAERELKTAERELAQAAERELAQANAVGAEKEAAKQAKPPAPRKRLRRGRTNR